MNIKLRGKERLNDYLRTKKMTLNEITLKYKTDKSSDAHNYSEKYEIYFSSVRNDKLKILEIGIQNGYSLKTWKEYFANSKIYGIDIVDCGNMDEHRIKTLRGSQNNLEFLERINNEYGPFDIIIDDGSHINNDMRVSFDFLFPLLRRGGLYVVEDLHCCYWPNFSEGNTIFMDRLKELLDCVNSGGKCGLANIIKIENDGFYQSKKLGEMNWWERNINFIHLYRSIVFIKKNILPKVIDKKFIKIDIPIKKIFKKKIKNKIKIFIKKLIIFFNKPKLLSENIAEYKKNIKIYDTFLFFNELELLEIRLNILDKYVDYFVIVEATRTFAGAPKKLFFEENKHRFKRFGHKIIHYIIDDMPVDKDELRNRLLNNNLSDLNKEIMHNALTSDNIPLEQSQWLREFYQKESIKKALVNLSDDDICFVSDLDEIWNPKIKIDYSKDDIFKLKQDVYVYYLNNRSSESWSGTYVTKYKNIKNNSINHLDTPSKTKYTILKNGGWHFTFQGGAEAIKKKIESYGHQEFNNDKIKSQIEARILNNQDFIGRKFKFWVDEKNLPEYILKNKDKYKKLFK